MMTAAGVMADTNCREQAAMVRKIMDMVSVAVKLIRRKKKKLPEGDLVG
jgi:hypothetical protein